MIARRRPSSPIACLISEIKACQTCLGHVRVGPEAGTDPELVVGGRYQFDDAAAIPGKLVIEALAVRDQVKSQKIAFARCRDLVAAEPGRRAAVNPEFAEQRQGQELDRHGPLHRFRPRCPQRLYWNGRKWSRQIGGPITIARNRGCDRPVSY
jgi:hypothetical protein